MRFFHQLCLIGAVLAVPASYAQETTPASPATDPATTATPAPEPTPAAKPSIENAVRDALGKQDSDVEKSNQQLAQTLTAVDKDYTLLKKGQSQLTYDLNYAYIGQQTINTDLASGNATLFSITNTNSHTFTNTFSMDYGVLNNLTGNVTLPLVTKYSQSPVLDGITNGLGDINFGARYQPFEAVRDAPSLTVTSRIGLPTGTSPFKVIAGSGVATGSGSTSLTGGLNVNQIVDPVALFGSVNLTYGLQAKANQILGNNELIKVQPGIAFAFGGGFAYALSYSITTSVSFQESISAGSKLEFLGGAVSHTSTQTGGVLSVGMGYRMTPKTTINTSIGIGLTANSPNLTLDFTVPFSL